MNPVCPKEPTGNSSPAIARVSRVDIPPEAALDRLAQRCCGRGKLRDRHRAEEPIASVEQHLAELRKIRGRGKDARMPGHAAHVASCRIVHHAAQNHAVFLHLRRCDARPQRWIGQISRFPHPERIEEDAFGVFILGHAAQALHNFAEQDEIDVAVDEPHFGRARGSVDQGSPNTCFVAAPPGSRSRSGLSPEKWVIRSRTVMALDPPWNSGR